MNRVQAHNQEIIAKAESRAREMSTWPSPLEEKMIEYLNIFKVEYEFQKIFYIYADDGWIIRYYIADFYIPATNVIIEVDGKFHDDHIQHDRDRTRTIQENYPGVRVFRFRWNDFHDEDKMDELMGLLWDY